jgi:hypothetical protein
MAKYKERYMKTIQTRNRARIFKAAMPLAALTVLLLAACEEEALADLRNQIAPLPAAVQGVVIRNAGAVVLRGGSVAFEAAVVVDGDISQELIWDLVDAEGVSLGMEARGVSINQDGLFTTSEQTATGTYYVRAASAIDESKTDTARVVVRDGKPLVESVRIEPAAITLRRGERFTFQAVLEGTEDADAVPTNGVIWSVKSLPDAAVTGETVEHDGNLTLAIADTETASLLVVTATSKDESGVSGAAVVRVPQVLEVALLPNKITLERGASQSFAASVTGLNLGMEDKEIDWTVTGGGAGTFIDANGFLTVSAAEPPGQLTVTAASQYDNGKTAAAAVTVTDVQVTLGNVTVYDDKGTTKQLRLHFNREIPGLTPNDISFTGATATITKGTTLTKVTGSASSYALNVTVTMAGNVTVQANKSGYAITNAAAAVAVNYNSDLQ